MLARSGGIAACALVLALAGTARADAGAALDRSNVESPRAARAYDAALEALRSGRHAQASRGFALVTERSPAFAPALRYRCEAERELGHFERAIGLCRAAVELEPSTENLLALSSALSLRGRGPDLERAADLVDRALRIEPEHGGALLQRFKLAALLHDADAAARALARVEGRLDAAEAAEAYALLAHLELDAEKGRAAIGHARRAVELDAASYEAHAALARAGFETEDDGALRIAASGMLRLSPDGAYANYVAGVVAAEDGRYSEAREYAERARALGMEPASCDSLLFAIDRRSPMVGGMLFPMALALAGGSTLFLSLLAFGALLSGATRRRLRASREDLASFESRHGRALRAAYGRVLFACIGYGYLFLPLTGVLVAGGVVAALRVFVAAGTLRVGLAIALLFVGGVFLFALIEAAFLRPRELPPGEVVDLGENPRLGRLLRGVAARLGTRPVERVYATPGTDLAILDRGSIGALLRGQGTRTLQVGVALLDGLRVRELEVLLAHEYGHHRSEGAAFGGLAGSIGGTLGSMEQALRESGAASALNPAWLLLRLCRRGLRAVSRGAMRLQEVCADEWTARLYGGRDLASALRQSIATRARFEEHAYVTLDEVVSASRGLSNLYTYRTRRAPDESRIADVIERRWSEGGEADRPSPKDRAERLSGAAAAPGPGGRDYDEDAPAWTLFASRDELETAMTDALREDLAREGVRVPDGDDEEPAPEWRAGLEAPGRLS